MKEKKWDVQNENTIENKNLPKMLIIIDICE